MFYVHCTYIRMYVHTYILWWCYYLYIHSYVLCMYCGGATICTYICMYYVCIVVVLLSVHTYICTLYIHLFWRCSLCVGALVCCWSYAIYCKQQHHHHHHHYHRLSSSSSSSLVGNLVSLEPYFWRESKHSPNQLMHAFYVVDLSKIPKSFSINPSFKKPWLYLLAYRFEHVSRLCICLTSCNNHEF